MLSVFLDGAVYQVSLLFLLPLQSTIPWPNTTFLSVAPSFPSFAYIDILVRSRVKVGKLKIRAWPWSMSSSKISGFWNSMAGVNPFLFVSYIRSCRCRVFLGQKGSHRSGDGNSMASQKQHSWRRHLLYLVRSIHFKLTVLNSWISGCGCLPRLLWLRFFAIRSLPENVWRCRRPLLQLPFSVISRVPWSIFQGKCSQCSKVRRWEYAVRDLIWICVAYVSMQRIETFLQEEEVDDWACSLSAPEELRHVDDANHLIPMGFSNAIFRWPGVSSDDSTSPVFELGPLDVTFPPGTLTVISGATASGKSAFLAALLGGLSSFIQVVRDWLKILSQRWSVFLGKFTWIRKSTK